LFGDTNLRQALAENHAPNQTHFCACHALLGVDEAHRAQSVPKEFRKTDENGLVNQLVVAGLVDESAYASQCAVATFRLKRNMEWS
jgi:hypothetical protein